MFDVCEKSPDSYLILCGDFNARTGSKNMCDVDDDFDVLACQNEDIFSRSSKDSESNIFGDQLLELCNMSDCIILNGLLENHYDDSCSFISSAGSSLVDYFVMSRQLFASLNVQSLLVESRVESDHLPVTMSVGVSGNASLNDNGLMDECEDKLVWNNDKEQLFYDCLCGGSVQSLITKATEVMCSDIDQSIDLFVNGLFTAGTRTSDSLGVMEVLFYC